ncbi:MAG: hypothetical protein AABW51_01850 [Nanoarchaeota archaeon]
MTKINAQDKQRKKNKILALLLMPLISIIAVIPRVMAHCPLCTGATIIGVGVTRSLGMDDSIIGIFVGAMIISSALWVNNILKKKNIGGSPFLRISSITAATFVLTFLSFYYAGLFGLGNVYRIFGIEKIVFGTLSGSLVSLLAFSFSNKVKQKKGRVLFNYQTIIFTFGGLVLNAILFLVIF